MSAWFILSSLGFYPVNPAGGEFVIGAPQVPSAKINVGNGKTFSMEAKNLSIDNKYVEKIELNGKPYDKQTISYKDIMNGSSLIFYMSDTPKK
jgi:putative alpha-1,2-mannosidase